jgi:CheY-like chemotaxis protein
MVRAALGVGTWHARALAVSERTGGQPDVRPRVWIVEDEPAAATLAAELCEAGGADPVVYRAPLPYLAALRDEATPAAVILDWRLQHELSAALYMATRHRHPQMPVIYWTGSPRGSLPAMIRDDDLTRVVDKAEGTEAFDGALAWALAGGRERSTA